MSFQEEYSDYLEHHGVKGMRWGVRKQKRYISKLNKRFKKLDKLAAKRNQIYEKGIVNRYYNPETGNKTVISNNGALVNKLDDKLRAKVKVVQKMIDNLIASGVEFEAGYDSNNFREIKLKEK